MTSHPAPSLGERPQPDLFAAAAAPARALAAAAGRAGDAALLTALVGQACRPERAKALADRLLAAFGDLGGVVAAPEMRLASVAGWDAAVVERIVLAGAVARRMARAAVVDRPVLSSWEALMHYLRVTMAHGGTERLHVLYLDRRNALIADEEAAAGTVDHVPVYPREVMRRALELDACAVILAHNHPSGDPTPSEADIEMTRAVRDAGTTLGIALHDHVVIGRGREVSFRGEGLL